MLNPTKSLILIVILALVGFMVGCSNPTAPDTLASVAGVYALQNVSNPVVADTVTITPLGANIEKVVTTANDTTNYGTWTYNTRTHVLTRQNGNTVTTWHYDGRSLTSGTQVFLKISQGA